jgi:nucleoside-diphosphate-sugar epimerase
MNVLVTGGAGYVGLKLTESLLEAGHKVTIMDNFMYGYDPIFYIVTNNRLHVIKKDIRNITKSDFKSYDVIFHLAGISGYPACEVNPHSAQVINVDATKRMLQFIAKSQYVIYASTTSFYGKSGAHCDEKSKITPVSLYGITKYKAEQYIMQRKNSVALRFATIFGVSSRMRNDLLVNDFAYKAINERSIVIFDGKSKRTFMHLSDAVGGYMFTLDNLDKMAGEIYNVGNEKMNFSKQDIAKAIKKYVQFEIINSNLADLDVRNFDVSFKKLNDLGYTVKYSLDDGVRELVKLYSFYKQYTPYKVI